MYDKKYFGGSLKMKKYQKILIVFFTISVCVFSGCKSKPETKPPVKPQPTEPQVIEVPVKDNSELLAKIDNLANENGSVNKARQRAVELQADVWYSEQFLYAEQIVENAKSDMQNEMFEDAFAKYSEAVVRYDTLSILMESYSTRKEIEENNFAHYSAEDYAEAERFSLNTLDHYELDYAMAKETAQDSLTLYKKVLSVGYREAAKNAKASAKESKADCDSIKVARSRTEDYNKAVRLFNEGKKANEALDYKSAFLLYNQSFQSFNKLYKETLEKRAAAELAIANAAQKQKESSGLALEADMESPMTDNDVDFSNKDFDLEDRTSPKSGEAIEDIDESEDETDEGTEEPANPDEGVANPSDEADKGDL